MLGSISKERKEDCDEGEKNDAFFFQYWETSTRRLNCHHGEYENRGEDEEMKTVAKMRKIKTVVKMKKTVVKTVMKSQ